MTNKALDTANTLLNWMFGGSLLTSAFTVLATHEKEIQVAAVVITCMVGLIKIYTMIAKEIRMRAQHRKHMGNE